jgi:hypothetical protein
MKRFVDIRHADISGYRFAWWDTVVDSFETHSGNMAWEHWQDFADDHRGDDLERYRALCPQWAMVTIDGHEFDVGEVLKANAETPT